MKTLHKIFLGLALGAGVAATVAVRYLFFSSPAEFDGNPFALARGYSVARTRAGFGGMREKTYAFRLENALLNLTKQEKNARDADGRTPAHFFAGTASAAFAEKWISGGGRLDVRDLCGASPLSAAAVEGNLPLVRMLFPLIREDGAAVGNALFFSVACRRQESLRLLMDLGADPNASVTEIAFGGIPVPILFAAIELRDEESVRILLAAGADPNARRFFGPEDTEGFSPLALSLEASSGIASALLDAGADPDEMIPRGDGSRMPILSVSVGNAPRAFAGDDDAMKITRSLVEHGAKTDVARILPSEGFSDGEAMFYGNGTMTIERRNLLSDASLWMTPLDESILCGNVPAMEYLLSAGAKFSPRADVQLAAIREALAANGGENPLNVYDSPIHYKETAARMESAGITPKNAAQDALLNIRNALVRNRQNADRVRNLLASPELSPREREKLAGLVLTGADIRFPEVFRVCLNAGGKIPDYKIAEIVKNDAADLAELVVGNEGAGVIGEPDRDGCSPLARSVAAGSLNVFRVFLKNGGDVRGSAFGGYSLLRIAELGYDAFPTPERAEILRLVKREFDTEAD